MPKSNTSILPALAAWSVTGRRGRTKPVSRSPETPEHNAARFLLSLSYPISAEKRLPPPPAPPAEFPENEIVRRRDRSGGTLLHECSVCPKRFRTGRALGGHMKCHLERDLKGRIVKKKMRKISSLGLGLELIGFGLRSSPTTPSLPAFSDEAGEGGGADAVDSSVEERSPAPASASLPW
ncbi:Zinc finger protein AZF2 [Apostasia shenzhenica]|uniref:Zinc finger protein AZF2 n=1 Tax=Apostasia shenzhenica TaxID=1088818 RepID=A0A2I0BH29_9ASPA|nr:Zinc finger protein AZF2 [Apostasia shenzhenica]